MANYNKYKPLNLEDAYSLEYVVNTFSGGNSKVESELRKYYLEVEDECNDS